MSDYALFLAVLCALIAIIILGAIALLLLPRNDKPPGKPAPPQVLPRVEQLDRMDDGDDTGDFPRLRSNG